MTVRTRHIAIATNWILAGIALTAEPPFLLLSLFCLDSGYLTFAQSAKCLPTVGFLPLMLALPFVAGSWFLLRRQWDAAALAVALAPLVGGCVWFIRFHR